MATRKKWLVFLANAVEIFHHKLLSTLLAVGWMCFPPAIATKAIAYSILGVVLCVLFSQILFRGPRGGDCALSVLEFSLRGLGGEEFDLKRLHAMEKLAASGVPRKAIYRRLLWQSGVYLLIVTIVLALIVTTLEYYLFR